MIIIIVYYFNIKMSKCKSGLKSLKKECKKDRCWRDKNRERESIKVNGIKTQANNRVKVKFK